MKIVYFDETKWALVPLEPNDHQTESGSNASCVDITTGHAEEVYCTMVENAPSYEVEEALSLLDKVTIIGKLQEEIDSPIEQICDRWLDLHWREIGAKPWVRGCQSWSINCDDVIIKHVDDPMHPNSMRQTLTLPTEALSDPENFFEKMERDVEEKEIQRAKSEKIEKILRAEREISRLKEQIKEQLS